MSSKTSDSEVSKKALLLYGSPETCTDLFYLGRFSTPDPFWALCMEEKRVAVLSALERNRAFKESCFTDILSLEELQEEAKKVYGNGSVVALLRVLLERYGVEHVEVPADFPAGLFCEIQSVGISVDVKTGIFFPQRLIKSPGEAQLIREANTVSSIGFAAAEKILRSAKIKKEKLYYRGRLLTSEILIQAIENACWGAGALASRTIAAGGDQACDPHCCGQGPLFANSLIVIDIFPRMRASGYYGDMTRTFLRGQANDIQCQLVETVRLAQDHVIHNIKANIEGAGLHQWVLDFFESRGYRTEKKGTQSIGFFHGTGHGIGLDIHEAPRISTASGLLPEGSVITVEPGLYYPGIGGVRIEDVVWIQKDGCEMLSQYSYNWIL